MTFPVHHHPGEGAKEPLYLAVTATYAMELTDKLIDATSGTFTITAPAAADIPSGRVYTIKNSGTGTITVDANGSETIDGSANVSLNVQYEGVSFISNGTNLVRVYYDAEGSGDALKSLTLAQFAATTSLQLKTLLSDETGSGSAVFATSPTLVTPALGTPASGVMTNVTGTAANLTSGNVTTNANLTGHVTSSGNAAVLGSFTVAQLNTAVSNETMVGRATTDTLTNKTLTAPTLTTPALGTPASGVMTNVTGIPVSALANGTDGELITWNASGVAAAVAVGSEDQVLTSNGAGAAPTFQAAAGGGGLDVYSIRLLTGK